MFFACSSNRNQDGGYNKLYPSQVWTLVTINLIISYLALIIIPTFPT